MEPTRHDRAPGDETISGETGGETLSGLLTYIVGLALATLLTATSFWAASTSALWAPGVPIGLAVLAVAQMGVHLVFFLHLSTGPDNTNNVLALAFGVLMHDTRQLRALGWSVCVAAAGACLVGTALHTQLAGRALGTFSDPNEFAAALVPAVALAYALLDTARSFLARATLGLVALLAIWNVLETQSRGGLIALLVAAATIFVTARGREQQ